MPIRAAVPDDLPALHALAVAFYEEDGFATGHDTLRANLATLITSPTARVAVSENGNRIVAFGITTTTFGLESGLVAELQDLYVTPDARRRGEGDRLIEDSRNWAVEQGCSVVEIVIAPNGQDVSHLFDFYSKRGFHNEDRRILSYPL